MFKRAIYPLLPASLRIQGRSYFTNCWRDLCNLATGKNDPELPPHRLNISGDGPFRKLGGHNVMLCRHLANLQPDETVLDLGCGIGRTALAMKNFLFPTGRYVGVDVVKFAIKWCKRHIGRRHPNFSFVHLDVYNRTYNPSGKAQPETYSLPFAPASFTFCLATSLFTHLLPAATEHYVAELGRLIAPQGRVLSSWFLLNDAAPRPEFPHVFELHAQRSLYAPEQAVAYRLDYVSTLLARVGFSIERVYFGGWSGRRSDADFGQDIIVANRLPYSV